MNAPLPIAIHPWQSMIIMMMRIYIPSITEVCYATPMLAIAHTSRSSWRLLPLAAAALSSSVKSSSRRKNGSKTTESNKKQLLELPREDVVTSRVFENRNSLAIVHG